MLYEVITLFYVSPRCCEWSGNSWPYATTQTLTAMANLLNDYTQEVVDRADFVELLRIYTRTQRKNGRPYVAEAAHPDNGSCRITSYNVCYTKLLRLKN